MPRKVVKTYLPIEIKKILELIASRLGLDESEVIRIALLDYASKHGILQEILKVH